MNKGEKQKIITTFHKTRKIYTCMPIYFCTYVLPDFIQIKSKHVSLAITGPSCSFIDLIKYFPQLFLSILYCLDSLHDKIVFTYIPSIMKAMFCFFPLFFFLFFNENHLFFNVCQQMLMQLVIVLLQY